MQGLTIFPTVRAALEAGYTVTSCYPDSDKMLTVERLGEKPRAIALVNVGARKA